MVRSEDPERPVAIPNKYDLMLPLLRLVGEGEVSLREATQRLADGFSLTRAEREERLPKGGRRRFDDRVAWARVYLRQAGLVDLPAPGRLAVTERGRRLLRAAPPRIDAEVLGRYPEFRAFLGRSDARTRFPTRSLGMVTVPEVAEETAPGAPGAPEGTLHTQVQHLLLRLGSDLGFGIWAARNDRGRTWSGQRFQDIPGMQDELRLGFEPATNRVIELIDVLWLRGRTIVAAFEIESTTSIHSGLLRMSDLVAMQPNINVRLYIVAPPERRERVIQEINRPTFSRLVPAMSEVCRFIPTDALARTVGRLEGFVRHLRPDFLDEVAEACDLPED